MASTLEADNHVKSHTSNKKTQKKYVQKFCENWMQVFAPWLTRCKDEPNKAFCRACLCSLNCNRCHIHKHGQTAKHTRNMQALLDKEKGAARQKPNLRKERTKYFKQRRSDESIEGLTETNDEATTSQSKNAQCEDNDNPNEVEANVEIMKDNSVPHTQVEPSRQVSQENHSSRAEIEQLNFQESQYVLANIPNDKNGFMVLNATIILDDMYTSRISNKPKTDVDFFFESVSCAVKTLPPKLIAEAKLRFTQILAELEIKKNDNQ